MSEEMAHLKSLEKILLQEHFDCCLEPEEVSPPFGRILVFLGRAEGAREWVLHITSQHQELGEALKTPPQPPQYMRTQFEVPFPFDVEETACNDVASLLAFLNRTLELPGFELDEMNHKIFYRYVHLHKRQEIDKTLLLGIIGVALMLFNMFSETIEQVALRKKSFNDILEEIVELSSKIYE